MSPSALPEDKTASNISPQDEIASLAATLERAKEDLELISYVASHDLQSPLRAILSACENLRGQKALADSSAQASLQKIVSETGRLKTLLHGVMDYLRLETFGPSRSLVDGNEIAEAARAVLEDKIRTTNAKISVDTLPAVYGHRGRLTRLFMHLLENSLKFHSSNAPTIHISARRQGTMAEFCVQDNGIGIDEEYRDIIFTLFQRLHPAGTYHGDGIGLALCRKIVEAHGGMIWMKSTPGEGTRFYFTLPIVRTDT